MNKIVNGKNFADVLNELRVKKFAHAEKQNYNYFTIDEFVSAFDNIVGVANYSVEYSDFQYSRITTEQEQYTVKCRITIFSDEGEPLLVRESYGGYACQYEKNTHKDVNLQNSSEFACHAAFKNAAKRFGIFGEKTDADSSKNSGGKQSTKNNASKNASNNAGNKNVVMNFVSKGKFVEFDTKDDRPCYKLDVLDYPVEENGDKVSQIIFYPNQYHKCAEQLTRCIGTCEQRPTRLRLTVQNVGVKNNMTQYVFKKFSPVA